MYAFRPPENINFDKDRAQAWEKFKEAFNYFSKATGIYKEKDEIQVASFMNLIGEQGREIFSTFSWSPGEDKDKFADVIKKFDQYCVPLVNVVYERYKFFSRKQKMGESIDEYLTDLRLLIKKCEFSKTVNIEDSLLRDKLVMDCNDDKLRERLLRENNIALSKALDIAHASELTKKQMESLNQDHGDSEVDLIRKSTHSKQCGRCGLSHGKQCPAFGKQCLKCRRTGHFVKCCRSSRPFNNNIDQLKD